MATPGSAPARSVDGGLHVLERVDGEEAARRSAVVESCSAARGRRRASTRVPGSSAITASHADRCSSSRDAPVGGQVPEDRLRARRSSSSVSSAHRSSSQSDPRDDGAGPAGQQRDLLDRVLVDAPLGQEEHGRRR